MRCDGRQRPYTEKIRTAHNIRLLDGTETYPAAGSLVEELGRFQAAKRILNLVFPDGLSGKRIADLGCLEGGYATGFARLGMNATGFEIRDTNFENCLYVKSHVGLPNLHFIKDDVNNIDKYGTFDAIWACGILYHVENPRTFMERISNASKKVVLLETHFTYPDRTPAADMYKLSEISEHEGLRGRWYHEHNDTSPEELENIKWASSVKSAFFLGTKGIYSPVAPRCWL
jgi:2-polyprenyl-3-methyl-5-hydroxy-6-metoxy-1,4-benzoquinol methylase